MNELEQFYRDKVDFIKFETGTKEGYCELARLGFSHVPAMVFIDRNGKKIFTVEAFTEKEVIKQKLDQLVAAP